MDKICCCLEHDLPDISFNVTCACCDSHVQEQNVQDVTDFDLSDEEEQKKEVEKEKVDEEDTTCCCCFRRKRHAKPKKGKKKKFLSRNGEKT